MRQIQKFIRSFSFGLQFSHENQLFSLFEMFKTKKSRLVFFLYCLRSAALSVLVIFLFDLFIYLLLMFFVQQLVHKCTSFWRWHSEIKLYFINTWPRYYLLIWIPFQSGSLTSIPHFLPPSRSKHPSSVDLVQSLNWNTKRKKFD